MSHFTWSWSRQKETSKGAVLEVNNPAVVKFNDFKQSSVSQIAALRVSKIESKALLNLNRQGMMENVEQQYSLLKEATNKSIPALEKFIVENKYDEKSFKTLDRIMTKFDPTKDLVEIEPDVSNKPGVS